MLQNAYFLAKIDADTAENERKCTEICLKLATTLRVHAGARRGRGRPRADALRGGLRGRPRRGAPCNLINFVKSLPFVIVF